MERREAIPKLPVLSIASLVMNAPPWPVPSVLDAPGVEMFRFGRVALDAALRRLGVGPEHEVLLPAYHCVSMVEPVLRAGARPVFYQVESTAVIDLQDLGSRISRTTQAAVVPHYFGFPQPMAEVRALCSQAGIALIEDCAHALFGTEAGRPLGSFGDYAIASPWKFLPVARGGCLVSHRDAPAAVAPDPVGLREELQTILNTAEDSLSWGRLRVAAAPLVPVIALSNWRSRKARALAAQVQEDPRRATVDVNATLPGLGRVARAILRHADRRRVVERRRAAYDLLLAEWNGLRRARPLHAQLDAGVVPQVFPLVMDEPEAAFARLKQAGVPIIRFGEFLWEGMPAHTCASTLELSRRVFQFPCHQELSDDELRWLATTVRRIVDDEE